MPPVGGQGGLGARRRGRLAGGHNSRWPPGLLAQGSSQGKRVTAASAGETLFSPPPPGSLPPSRLKSLWPWEKEGSAGGRAQNLSGCTGGRRDPSFGHPPQGRAQIPAQEERGLL